MLYTVQQKTAMPYTFHTMFNSLTGILCRMGRKGGSLQMFRELYTGGVVSVCDLMVDFTDTFRHFFVN